MATPLSIQLYTLRDEMWGDSAAVRSGKVNVARTIGAAAPNVLRWLFAELDRCGADLWEEVRRSRAYLTEKGLARAANKSRRVPAPRRH